MEKINMSEKDLDGTNTIEDTIIQIEKSLNMYLAE